MDFNQFFKIMWWLNLVFTLINGSLLSLKFNWFSVFGGVAGIVGMVACAVVLNDSEEQ